MFFMKIHQGANKTFDCFHVFSSVPSFKLKISEYISSPGDVLFGKMSMVRRKDPTSFPYRQAVVQKNFELSLIPT